MVVKTNPYEERIIVGFLEWITCYSKSKRKKELVKARIDTGATKSSIDQDLAKKLGLGPIVGEKTVRNAHGTAKRKIVELTIQIADKIITEEFTIADRSNLRFPMLIGRNILRHDFLIDPKKRISKAKVEK